MTDPQQPTPPRSRGGRPVGTRLRLFAVLLLTAAVTVVLIGTFAGPSTARRGAGRAGASGTRSGATTAGTPSESTSPSPSAEAPSPSSTPDPTATPTWPPLAVTALGDSVTAGAACDCDPFPTLYAADLHRLYRTPTTMDNYGVSGETSADVLNDLKTDQAEQSDVRGADVVVLTIGANDFADQYDLITTGRCGGTDQLECVRDDLTALRRQLTAIVAQVHALRGDQSTAVLMTGYWNVFEDGDVATSTFSPRGVTGSVLVTKAANAVIEDVAEQSDATYVDLYAPFKGASDERDPTPLLAADGDHPNAAGHRVIAAALLDAGVAPLTAQP